MIKIAFDKRYIKLSEYYFSKFEEKDKDLFAVDVQAMLCKWLLKGSMLQREVPRTHDTV